MKNTLGCRVTFALVPLLLFLVVTAPTLLRAENLEIVESKYNTILVQQDGPYVLMRFGYNQRLYTESVFNTQDALDLPVEYTRQMMAGFSYTGGISDVLEIGSGGGRLASYVSSTFGGETHVTTVELDPEVIRLSEKYFQLRERPNLEIVLSDGRLFLLKNEAQYDVIFVDAYRGPFVPFHLLTTEFYELTARRLKEGGVLVQNVEPSTMLFDAAISTIGTVYNHVDLFPARGNVVVVAYKGDEKPNAALMARAGELDERYGPRYPIESIIDARLIVDKTRVTERPLTDDFAPAEYLRSIEMHNRRYEDITK